MCFADGHARPASRPPTDGMLGQAIMPRAAGPTFGLEGPTAAKMTKCATGTCVLPSAVLPRSRSCRARL